MNKEIKVMNNDEIRDFCIKKDLKIFELEQELQQKDNIIKEVREYIEKEKAKLPLGRNDFTCEMVYSDEVVLANELLEILDKGEPNGK